MVKETRENKTPVSEADVKKLKDFGRFYLLENNPEARSFVHLLMKKSKPKRDNSNNNSINIEEDAKTLMQFLSPSTALIRTNREKKETVNQQPVTVYRVKEEAVPKQGNARSEYLDAHFPDVILIPGNNDLTQIEEFAKTLFSFRKYLIEKGIKAYSTDNPEISEQQIREEIVKKVDERISNIPIVISGKGGHGVAPGPIFASTEAEAMGHYLQSLLQYQFANKNPIILEKQATNSGQNIDFTKKDIKKIAQEAEANFLAKFPKANFPGITMWLVPTPVGGVRQLATVSQQAETETSTGGPGYPINQIYMLPPNEEKLIKNYFSGRHEDVCINMFAALRETVNHLGYMLDNDFMSPHAPNEDNLRNAMKTVLHYYEVLTGKKISSHQQHELIENMVRFSKLKENAGGIMLLSDADKTLRDKIKNSFDPIKTYFQMVFNQIERQHMPYLPGQIEFAKKEVNLAKQESFTKQQNTLFARHHLLVDPPEVSVDREKQHKKI